MFEESADIVPSTWESMISWFTPSVLFVLLNLMIGTILFTSNSTNNNKNHDQKPQNQSQRSPQQEQEATKIVGSPSVLQRIKSINFYPHRSQETPTTNFKPNQDFPPLDQTLESAATQYVFSHVLEHQETPNSLTHQTLHQETPNPIAHFTFDHQTHLQETPNSLTHQTPNPITHFTFDHQTHLQETPNPLTHFTFDQTLHQEIPDSTVNFASVQTYYQENPLKNTHFVYAHEDSQIVNPHFVFAKPPHQETKDTTPQFVPDQTHVKKSPKETQFVLDQIHVKKTPKETLILDQTHIKKSPKQIPEQKNVKKSPIDEETAELQSMEEAYNQLKERHPHVTRTTSATKPASGAIPRKLPEKMKKSASLKSSFSHFEEEKIVEARRPATVRERPRISEEDDGEVDAKADDFINKFKHQLKLQRIDSIIRYKDMITRGSEK